MIIVDENVDQQIINYITDKGYNILSICEVNPGISDREIIRIAEGNNAVIITEDKDFGA